MLPYIGSLSSKFQRELQKIFTNLVPAMDLKFIFVNPIKIGSLFKFKDSLSSTMMSSVIYKFTCQSCMTGTYLGSTKRLLKVRIDEHMGISPRTGSILKIQKHSSVRDHTNHYRVPIDYSNFKVMKQCKGDLELLIYESLLIKQKIIIIIIMSARRLPLEESQKDDKP